MVWWPGHSFIDSNALHNGNAFYQQPQPVWKFVWLSVNQSAMKVKWHLLTRYINLSSLPAGEVSFGHPSWFMHLISFVWADSAAQDGWLKGEEAGRRLTSWVAAALMNSLVLFSFICLSAALHFTPFSLRVPVRFLALGRWACYSTLLFG